MLDARKARNSHSLPMLIATHALGVILVVIMLTPAHRNAQALEMHHRRTFLEALNASCAPPGASKNSKSTSGTVGWYAKTAGPFVHWKPLQAKIMRPLAMLHADRPCNES